MADMAKMEAEPRETAGKGAARAMRRDGRVPGVIYGRGGEPMSISVDQKTLTLSYQRGGFFSRLFDLSVGKETVRALPREVQTHPVTDLPIHVDFLRLAADSEINVEVAAHFFNEEESPGIKRGGVLNVVRHTIELVCRADSIPESIDIDLTGLDIGDSVHISAISLPEGVSPAISDRDFTIATVAAPTIIAEPEDEEDEDEEGLEGEEGEGEEGEGEEGEGEGDEKDAD